MSNAVPNTVYISYSGNSAYKDYIVQYAECHKGMERDTIMKELVMALDNASIPYKVDNVDNRIGSITQFENEIGDADIVVIILSDKYFVSPHCMYEWEKIYENPNSLKVYIILDQENIYFERNGELLFSSGFCFTGNEGSQYKNLLNKSWTNWCDHEYAEFTKDYNTPPLVFQYAYDKKGYRDVFDNVTDRLRGNVSFKTSERNVATKIANAIKDYMSKNKKYHYKVDYSDWDDIIENIKNKDTILLVGDRVLEIGSLTLDEYFDSIIFEEANKLVDETLGAEKGTDLQDWYMKNCNKPIISRLKNKGYSAINNEDKKIINTINSNLFTKLLDTGFFNCIFSVGYTRKIYDIVASYAIKHNYVFAPRILGKKAKKFGDKRFTDTEAKLMMNGLNAESNRKKTNKFYFFDLIHSGGKDDELIFSELDIVRWVNSCIAAINFESSKIFGKHLLVLGTNFPSWALRFIWYSLIKPEHPDEDGKKKSLIANTEIENETRSFISTYDVCFIDKECSKEFIEYFLSKINNTKTKTK